MSGPAALAVLASGGGRSLENLEEVIRRGELAAEIRLVLTNKPGLGAQARAERLGLPHRLIPHADFDSARDFSAAVFGALDEAGCELAILAGFLRRLFLPTAWHGRVLNIHPALLPKYGGQGFYGDRVHRAVLEAGEEKSGCTVHWVDDEYDHGSHLLQREVPVRGDDTVDTLAARVFEEEKRALPEAIRMALAARTR